MVPKDKPMSYFVRAQSDESELELRDISVQRFERHDSNWSIDRISIKNLEPGRSYGFEVRDVMGELVDTREFYALDLDKSKVRLAAASCLNETYIREQRIMWKELLARKPEILFLLGDNVYASRNKPLWGEIKAAALWAGYVQSRLTLDLFRSPSLVPTLAVWDDNDFGVSDGDREYKYRKESAEIFRIFFAQEPDALYLTSGPGTSRFLKAFQMGFVLMDNRYFRSPNGQSVDDETHWGTAQEKWLMQNLQQLRKPVWLLNGDQIFGGYHQFESYEGNHPNSFKKIMAQIGARPEPIAFLTGDRHLTEVMQVEDPSLKMKTFEITTSPLHAKTFPSSWAANPNKRQLEGQAGKLNYVVIDSENAGGDLQATVTAFSQNNEILFHRFLSIQKTTKKLKTF